MGPFGNLGISIGIDVDTGNGTGIFLPFEALIFVF